MNTSTQSDISRTGRWIEAYKSWRHRQTKARAIAFARAGSLTARVLGFCLITGCHARFS